MNQQIAQLWADAKGWVVTHPVIFCMGVALVIVSLVAWAR